MTAHSHSHGHISFGEKFQTDTAKVSMAVALILVLAKIFVAWSSHSIGVASTALDSAMDMVASALVFIGLKKAHEAADEDHPYGHGKAEGLASLAQALLIALASFGLIREAILRIQDPVPLQNVPLAIWANVGFALTTLTLTFWIRHRAKLSGSLALRGDSAHYATDLLGYIAVLGGLLYSQRTSAPIYDTAASLIVGGYLATTALSLARDSVDELMDKGFSPDETKNLETLIQQFTPVKSHHLLKTRKSGPNLFVEFHAVLPQDLSFVESHRIIEKLEDLIMAQYPGAKVLIHADPMDDHHHDIAREQGFLPKGKPET